MKLCRWSPIVSNHTGRVWWLDAILSKLTGQQRQELRKEALTKYAIKKNINSYGPDSLKITLLLADAVVQYKGI
jgi:hypothetical protein